MTIAAFVPMRHTSERVRGKNYRPLGGKPLFHHIVDSLLVHPAMADPLVVRKFKEVAQSRRERQTLVLAAAESNRTTLGPSG